MTLNHSYQKELEILILDTLLPAYVKYEKTKGNLTPLKNIHPELLSQIKRAKSLPRLLKPKESWT